MFVIILPMKILFTNQQSRIINFQSTEKPRELTNPLKTALNSIKNNEKYVQNLFNNPEVTLKDIIIDPTHIEF